METFGIALAVPIALIAGMIAYFDYQRISADLPSYIRVTEFSGDFPDTKVKVNVLMPGAGDKTLSYRDYVIEAAITQNGDVKQCSEGTYRLAAYEYMPSVLSCDRQFFPTALYAFGVAAAVYFGLAALGWVIGWITAGFRQAKPE